MKKDMITNNRYLAAIMKRLQKAGFAIQENVRHKDLVFDLVASLTVKERHQAKAKGGPIVVFTNLFFMLKILDTVDSKGLRSFVRSSTAYGLGNLQGPGRKTTHFLFPVAICSKGSRKDLRQIELKGETLYKDSTVLVPMLVTPRNKTAEVHRVNWPADIMSTHGAWLTVVDAINLLPMK